MDNIKHPAHYTKYKTMNKDFWNKLIELQALAKKQANAEWYSLEVGEREYAVFSKTKPEAIVAITHIDEDGSRIGLCKKNAEYIAAANPAMILAMIERIKLLELDVSTANMDLFAARHQAKKNGENQS